MASVSVIENDSSNKELNQTLDSLLKDPNDDLSKFDSKLKESNENWYSSVNAYIKTLKPKDVIILFERIKFFNKNTVFMKEFNGIFNSILKHLNGGEPLKNDFGYDKYTSLYSLFSFSKDDIIEECKETPMIYNIFEKVDSFTFKDSQTSEIHIERIVNHVKNKFLELDSIRDQQSKRKRYFIFVCCSNINFTEELECLNVLKEMKVRFSCFSPQKDQKFQKLFKCLNYKNENENVTPLFNLNKWPVCYINGLEKVFDTASLKRSKLESNKDSCEYDNDLMSIMNFDNYSNIQSFNDRVGVQTNIDVKEVEDNINVHALNQSNLMTAKLQPKIMPASIGNYYPFPVHSHKNQSYQAYQQSQEQVNTPNSAPTVSHRSTPSSIAHSHSPQVNVNIMPQTVSSEPDRTGLDNVESAAATPRSLTAISEQEMVYPMYKHANFNYNNMYSSGPMTPRDGMNRTMSSMTHINRMNSNTIFEGEMKYNGEQSTHLKIMVENGVDINAISMQSWEGHCQLHFFAILETFKRYLKLPNSNEDNSKICDGSIPYELSLVMNPHAHEFLSCFLKQKNTHFAFVRPYKDIPPDTHPQIFCILYYGNSLKAFIPNDPKGLFNEIKNKMPNPISNYDQRRNAFIQNPYFNMPPTIQFGHRNMMNHRYGAQGQGAQLMSAAVPNNHMYRNVNGAPSYHITANPHIQQGLIINSGHYSTAAAVHNPNNIMQLDPNMQSNQAIYDSNAFPNKMM